jgi:diadenosine tetraphosphatase ApaH/serine/threonine PP2A family protein phosphatase
MQPDKPPPRMKLALVTDLHANRESVSAVLAHAQAQGAQRHAFLGDFVGYGADPGWVVDVVREHVARGALAVMGNHDAAVVQGPSPSMIAEARQVVEWTRARLNPAQLDFLATLPMTRREASLLFVHANAWAPASWAYVTGRVEAMRSLLATDAGVVVCGHMHDPRLFHLTAAGKGGEFVPVPGVPIPLSAHRRWLVIPGSAGQPRDGNPAACYAMLDTASMLLTYHRVPYDVNAAGTKIRAAGLPQRLAARLTDGD